MCACLTLFIIACTDENKKADTPIASVIVNTTQLEINQSMEIQFTGIADQAVIYTGFVCFTRFERHRIYS